MCQQRFRLLKHESCEEFEAMTEDWRSQHADLSKEHPAMRQLINQVIERDWMQLRCLREIDELQAQLWDAQANHQSELVTTLEKQLQSAYRYKTSAENSFARAQRTLEQFRKARLREYADRKKLQILAFDITERAIDRRLSQSLPDEMEDLDTPDVFNLFDDDVFITDTPEDDATTEQPHEQSQQSSLQSEDPPKQSR